MTRRDKTTGRPRRRESDRAAAGSKRGFSWSETHTRLAILSSVGVLLLLVLGLIVYEWYDENVGKPNKTILQVDDQEFSLEYFTERIVPFATENPRLSRGFLEPALLTKLEEEAVTIAEAERRGIDTSDDAVTQYIAEELGVAPGGAGTPFDTLYRQRLRETGLSNSDYRQLSRAALAESAILEQITEELGDTGPKIEMRVVVLGTEADANEVVERIEGGEDMGTIAQTDSSDIESRQQDGLLTLTPPELFPESVRTAMEGQEPGTLLGPVLVQSQWWVFRVERVEEESTYTDTDKEQLAESRLAALLSELRSAANITRSLSDSDIEWAYRNVN
jgi:hypothetical protein